MPQLSIAHVTPLLTLQITLALTVTDREEDNQTRKEKYMQSVSDYVPLNAALEP